MPPKKDDKAGKGGKGGKGAAVKPRVSIGPPAPPVLSEESKEFYLVQIRDLEIKIDRYQKRCDELEVRNAEFRQKFDQMSDDKTEIVVYIKKKLDEKTDEIADLNDRLVGLQQAKDSEKEQFEQQLAHLRSEYREVKDKLTAENMILSGKLASLEEFKVQREEIMAKLASLEEQLIEQAERHKEDIYNLEKKQVIDKDKLKKEMITRVNEVAAEFRKVSNRQMAETTKRTIRENVSINAQLTKMSDKTEDLIDENDTLRDREKRQRQQMELLEANEKEQAKKNLSNQKIIKMLSEKCKMQEAGLLEYQQREEHYRSMAAEATLLNSQLENVREELTLIAEENEILNEDLEAAKTSLDERVVIRQKVEKVLTDATNSLMGVLSAGSPEDCTDTKADISAKREAMLENLLLLLNSAAELGLGPSVEDMGPRVISSTVNKVVPPPVVPSSAKGADAKYHYKLGDVGFIPAPDTHISTNIEKAKVLEAERLYNTRKMSQRTASTQTVSTVKAMFFADQVINRFGSMSAKQSTTPTLPVINCKPSKPVAAKVQ